MGARLDIADNALLEVPAVNTLKIKKHIVAAGRQILIDRQRPRHVGTSVTDENRLLDTPRHIRLLSRIDEKIIQEKGPARLLPGTAPGRPIGS